MPFVILEEGRATWRERKVTTEAVHDLIVAAGIGTRHMCGIEVVDQTAAVSIRPHIGVFRFQTLKIEDKVAKR
jgi:hypothetical protein